MFVELLLGVALLLTMAYLLRRLVRGEVKNIPHSAEGKTFIVTGANSGIGLALTEELVRRGGRVVMGCRSKERAEKARDELREKGLDTSLITIELVDLMDFQSIRRFSERIAKNYDRVDVLINNAGGLRKGENGKTKEGLEYILHSNYLGHFLLVESLRRKHYPISRVVYVSSILQLKASTITLSTPLSSTYQQYSRAKLAEVCHAQILTEEGIPSFSCHPGVVNTNILAGTKLEFAQTYFSHILSFFMKSSEEGAQTPLMLAVSPLEALQPGEYYSDYKVSKKNELSKEYKALYEESLSLVEKWL